MKKIILSVLAIMLTVGVVSGTAYALFFHTVNIAGVTITTGNADLVITDKGTGTLVSTMGPSLSGKLSNMFPGQMDYTNMVFTNQSTSAIGLNLAAQITTVGGDWGLLYNKIEMAIGDSTNNSFNLPTTWNDLNWWRDAQRSFGTTLVKGTPQEWRVFIRVKGDAGNEIAGKWLTGMTLTFTGTQVTP